MEYKREIKVFKSQIGHGEKEHLNGKCSYLRVFNYFIRNAVLCNNIVNVDPDIFCNQETGFSTYDELYNEKIEELKKEYQGKIVEGLGITSEQIQNGFKTLEELEEMAQEYAEDEIYNYEFYQYFIIDISNYNIKYLQELDQKTLQIMYSNILDCYILGVGHFGTSWDYVGSDFELVETEG